MYAIVFNPGLRSVTVTRETNEYAYISTANRLYFLSHYRFQEELYTYKCTEQQNLDEKLE